MADDNDTAPATGRDCEAMESDVLGATTYDAGHATLERPKAWLDALQKQLTATMLDRVRKFALKRVRQMATAGQKVDDLYARELVNDAVTDTWSGVLAWDPARCSLDKHLATAVKTRTHKRSKRHDERPHISLGDDSRNARRAEREASAVDTANRVIERIYARQIVDQIRAAAANDKDVLRILDAYEAGAQTRDDVRVLTKMRERTYHNAHIRLMRIVRNVLDCTPAPTARA